MKLFQRWSKIILILALFTLGVVMINLMNFFGSEPEMVSAPIPEDAEMIVRVDAKTLWRKGVHSIVFESENYSMIDQELKKIINKKFIKRTSNILPIDFNKDVVAFLIKQDQQNYQVAVFQLMDVAKFIKMTREEKSRNALAFSIGNSGYIIYGPNKPSKAAFEKIKAKIMKSAPVAFESLGDRSNFISIHSGIDASKSNYAIGIEQMEKAFKIKGDINTKIDFEPMKYSVKNKGLGITLAYNPEELTSSIGNNYPEMKMISALIQVTDPFHYFADKQLTGISVDYYGVQVENSIEGLPSIQGMLPLAKMNAVYRFDKKLNMDSVMACFPKEVHTGPTTINLHGMVFHLRLIDDNNLFVGVDENAVIPGSRADLFRLKGALSNITNINSSSFFVKAVLQNFKPIKILSGFAKATKTVDFAIQQTSTNHFAVSGVLPFKEDKNAVNEVFKFIILAREMPGSGRMAP